MLLKNSAIYFGANAINALAPFLLLPIYARYLEKGDFGKLSMFIVFYMGLSVVMGLGSQAAASRKYYDDINESDLTDFNSQCINLLIYTFVFFVLIISIFKSPLQSLLSIPLSWMIVGTVIALNIFILQFRLIQWQVRNKAKSYAVLQIVNSCSGLLITVLFLFFISNDSWARVIGLLITTSMVSLFCMVSLWRSSLIKVSPPNLRYLREILTFSVPLLPHVVSMFVLNWIDRVIINAYSNLEEVALFTMASQLSLGVIVIFDAINKAFVPWLFEQLKSGDLKIRRKIVTRTYQYFALLVVSIPVVFIISKPIILLIGGQDYEGAASLFNVLYSGQVLVGMYLMVTNYLFYMKKTALLSLTTLISAGIHIFLSIILIQEMGTMGVATSFLFAMFVRFFLVWFASTKAVKMPWFQFNQGEVK